MTSQSFPLDLPLEHPHTRAGTLAPAVAPATLRRARKWAAKFARDYQPRHAVFLPVLPGGLGADFACIAAFCRAADEATRGAHPGSDRVPPRSEWGAQLTDLRDKLSRCTTEHLDDQLFIALAHTITKHHLPTQLFSQLLDGFEHDQRGQSPETWPDALAHARNISGTLGKLFLMLCDYRPPDETPQTAPIYERLDALCSAMFLARCWRDVKPDLISRGTSLIPAQETGLSTGVLEHSLTHAHNPHVRRQFHDELKEMVRRTRELFAGSAGLASSFEPAIAWEIWLMQRRGGAILDSIERGQYATLWETPGASAFADMKLSLRASLGTLRGKLPRIAHGY